MSGISKPSQHDKITKTQCLASAKRQQCRRRRHCRTDFVSSNNEDWAISDGNYVGEVVNYKPHGKGMFTIANISYLGDWFSRVWDKGCCVRVEIVYFVNGMKLVATSEDRKGTMVLDDGSKHVGVGI